MAELAIHPPVHVVTDPDEPIRSLGEAAAFVRQHAGDAFDQRTQGLLHRIERASSPEEADAAGHAFQAWAQEHGLLLIPPEDSGKTAP
jgi:hypothetical protein